MTDPRVEEVLARLTDLRAGDAPTRGGRVLSYVYDPGLAVVDELARRAAEQVQHVNGLDPTAFGSVARMEADVIGFAAGLVHGADTVGVVTSGGTESCLLAVKSARDRWRTRHPGVAGPPVIVAPVTAHAAFHKAAEYQAPCTSSTVEPKASSWAILAGGAVWGTKMTFFWPTLAHKLLRAAAALPVRIRKRARARSRSGSAGSAWSAATRSVGAATDSTSPRTRRMAAPR